MVAPCNLLLAAVGVSGTLARIPASSSPPSPTTDSGPSTETQDGPIVESPAMPVTVTTVVTGIPSLTYSLTSLSSPTGLAVPTPTKLPKCKQVQTTFAPGQGGNQTRAEAIVEAYVHGWNGYRKYAWGYDELEPLSLKGTNDYYGWGLSVVDGIDTAIIMNLTSIVQEQLEWIAGVDFSTTTYGPVAIFDACIRYVGGLISAYDLLKSGQFPNPYGQNLTDTLLKQAVVLADKLSYAFNTPSGIPASNVNFTNNQPVYSTYTVNNYTYNATNTAQAGSLLLEFSRLSDLTGNETYRYLVERAENVLVNPHPPPRYPGLIGTEFDTDSGDMLSFDGGWHSGIDSCMEYMIKVWQYKPSTTVDTYKDFWLNAVKSTILHLALHPYGWPDLTFISELDVNGSITWSMDDFSDFAGGNFLLGGQLLNNSMITQLGLATTDSAYVQYNRSLTGLGAIGWQWFNSEDKTQAITDDNDVAAHRNNDKFGFWVPDGDENWDSRPEEIESLMYAYRITGDERWAEYTWQIFEAINATARTPQAFAEINNVEEPFGGSMGDELEAFFFAEVLKYLYVTQASPDVLNLDQWVYNTESHPFLVQCDGGNVDDYAGNGTTNGTWVGPRAPGGGRH
ncbi:glycoside hydrolase [Xylariaceae sp. FL0804]|nr:glycoside hydrolase [Xylariaceae sp. FL0804]